MRDPNRDPWTGRLWQACSEYIGLLVVIVVLVLYFGSTTERFLSKSTLRTIASQIPDAVIIAVGMTFVLIIGGIDLSVGSVLALSSVVMGVCIAKAGAPIPLAIAACLGVGLACGAFNGLVSVAWGIPSFIVTLGMLEMARGATYLVTDSRTIYLGSAVRDLAKTPVLGLPAPFLLALLVVAGGQVLLTCTVLGRHMVAVGCNEEAVRLSGIDPRRVKLRVFILCGFLVSVAAVVHTARLENALPNTGTGYELRAIAAVVIGGTSLMGGRGSVVASFLGVLIIEVLYAGLYQFGAEEYTKRLIVGAVIVLAVIVDTYRRRLALRHQAGASGGGARESSA
jgi:ribose transport system permease protein